jgi:CheY-specific phosphatase CheX
MQLFGVDEYLVNVLVKATRDGLAMANLKPVPTGVSRYYHSHGMVSAIIGFVGPTSGSITLNTSERTGCFMAGRKTGDEVDEFSGEALDGLCEICNIIAGQTKAICSTSEHKFDRISVPSIVVGSSYYINHYKGLQTITVEFELPEMKTPNIQESTFSVSLCMMKV